MTKKKMRKFSVVDTEELRDLCIRNGWFTAGSSRQYEKMFCMNDECRPIEEIALVIWLCSSNVTREDVQEELEMARETYQQWLSKIQEDGE